MSELPPAKKPPGRGCAVHVLICSVYAAANVMAVRSPFIPGMEVAVLWGYILPGLGIPAAWLILGAKRRQGDEWFYTVFLMGCGLLTWYSILRIWLAI